MKKIISFILIFNLCLMLFPAELFAQEEEVLTAPEEACQSLKPNYAKDEEIVTLKKNKPMDRDIYDKLFERTQTLYHSYMECMFGFAENTVYKTGAASFGGGVQANTPNTKVIDWMAPDQACLAPSEIKKIIEETTPVQMLGPALQAHKDYKDYLNALGKDYANRGVETDSSGNQKGNADGLNSKANSLDELGRERQVEIDSAMVTLDLMLTSLKELRLAFVMHVRFQCTLKFLDKYRSKLGDLRKLIQPLPGQLRDASITK